MTPENPAHKVLISATQRTWGDFRDTEEMEQTKKDMKKMRRELHDSKSDTDVKKKENTDTERDDTRTKKNHLHEAKDNQPVFSAYRRYAGSVGSDCQQSHGKKSHR